jgi:N-methylhydantoinase A/oxoprolinase/acetone carboxylase beta subunit
MPDLRFGVDLGETHAEAVVLDDSDRVLARARTPVGENVEASLRATLDAVSGCEGVDPRRITRAVLGSAAALEAIEQRRGLRRVAVLRIGAPLTLAIPPLATWPAQLRAAVSAGEAVVSGGAEYDGRMVLPLDEEAVTRFLASVAGAAESVAVTSLFSPISPDHELAAAEIVRRELGGSMRVSLSHEIGTMGLLERENASVLNAALFGVVERLLETMRETLEQRRVDAELFFAKGDGTVMTPEHSLRFPVHMLGSGPASGIRGGAWLSGAVDGVSFDVAASGATVGMLVNGRPHERTTPIDLMGIRANLRLPEILTLALGGGAIDERALTATLEVAVRVQPVATYVVLGHGAAATELAGRLAREGEAIVPGDGEVARAVGLVIAPAGGLADRICVNRGSARATTLEAARADALAHAIHAGADPDGVRVVEVEEVPLTGLLDPPIRITVRAAGPLV